MPKISTLSQWLARKTPLDNFPTSTRAVEPSQEYGGFIGIDVAIPLHDSGSLEAESLETAWKKTHSYMISALEIIKSDAPTWLDREEVEMIRDGIGEPPSFSYPLYFISVRDHGGEEKVVYVGKTSSKVGRFVGGHRAHTLLHHPKYDGLSKTIYLALVLLLDESKNYVPLEWIAPLPRAITILNSVEAQLIYELKPELNRNLVTKYKVSWPTVWMIENHSGASRFLHEEMISPR